MSFPNRLGPHITRMGAKQPPKKIWLITEADLPLPMPTRPAALNDQTTSAGSQDYCAILDADRDSVSSSFSRISIMAHAVDTKANDTDFGVLRAGPALELRSWEAFGLLSQYAGVGVMMGFFDVLAHPIFQNYMHMEGYQSASYTALINFGWSSKILFGMLGDCFPIHGYKRRAYMVVGWLIAAASCLVMALSRFPAPYYTTKDVFEKPRLDYTSADLAQLNLAAPLSGGFFIMMSLLACLGFVMAMVAADALVIQAAQREPIATRGRVQTAMYITRDAFSTVPMLLVGFCMNDFKYGGEFDWAVEPNVIFGFVVAPCLLAAAAALFFMVELPEPATSFWTYVKGLWHLVQQRVVWQLCIFKLFHSMCINYNSTLKSPLAYLSVWVAPNVIAIFLIVAQLFRLAAMYGIGRYALNWNWRVSIAVCTIVIALLDTAVNLGATWDVPSLLRLQVPYSLLSSLSAIPEAIIFLFNSYLIVEVADVGNEAMTFALLTSCTNLGWPLGTVLAKTFDSFLTTDLGLIEDDSTATRWQISYSLFASCTVKLFSLAFLVLMPQQKAYVHAIKRTGSSGSRLVPLVFLIVFVLAYVVAFVSNVLAILPGTSCLAIAGGKGC
ncbi:Aste57867_1853 [Aphanomyces stellatus]|uniref:Aste57867_1853 protein n=1 Tax=Aphanomyces stellatus TaxID=120398 RepID=A0A485K776_9STRA|nr:hypothetical protein As57867_001851 [Aphanomyces stellatus]VFT79060.1 Aste57867_1853 [Aphanomyces stellatus]